MRKASIEILDADRPLLVGRIVFCVDRTDVFEFIVGPHGDRVSVGKSAQSLKRVGGNPKMEDYLPHGWDYEQFMIAWSFWVKGKERGAK